MTGHHELLIEVWVKADEPQLYVSLITDPVYAEGKSVSLLLGVVRRYQDAQLEFEIAGEQLKECLDALGVTL